MPHRTARLHEHVGELLGELRGVENAHEVRDELIELEAVQAELGRILADNEPPGSAPIERLRRALAQFEDRHPNLTLLSGRVADALSDLGL